MLHAFRVLDPAEIFKNIDPDNLRICEGRVGGNPVQVAELLRAGRTPGGMERDKHRPALARGERIAVCNHYLYVSYMQH